MRLALAQLNPVVGDLRGNAERILAAAIEASAGGATLLLTPELSLWGYPPRDLLLQPARRTYFPILKTMDIDPTNAHGSKWERVKETEREIREREHRW